MKKIFTLFAAAMISACSFAQGVFNITGYEDGALVTPAPITSVEGIKVTLGPVNWKAKNTADGSSEQIIINGNAMSQRLEGQATNPTPNKGAVPTEGAFIKAETSIDGTLYMGCVINAGKDFYVVENDTPIESVQYAGKMDGEEVSGTIAAGGKLDSKLYGYVTVSVKAGSTYYFYVGGSKISFGGFELSTGSSAIQNVEAAAAQSVRKVATANGIQIVKAGKKFNVAGQEL